jgi:hypothetical protein
MSISTFRFNWLGPRPLLGVFVALSVAGLSGCGQPDLNTPEYGQILKELPRVKGSDKLFPLPRLETPEEKPGAAK